MGTGKAHLPRINEHDFGQIEKLAARCKRAEDFGETILHLRSRHRLALDLAAARHTAVIGITLAAALRPGCRHGITTAIAEHETAQRKIFVEVGPRRRSALLAFQSILNALEGLEADQTVVLALAKTDTPFRGFDVACIDHLLEEARYRHRTDRAVLTVFREIRTGLKEALDLGLRDEAARSVALQSLAHDRGQRLIGYKHLAATTLGGNVFVSGGCAEHPKPVLDPRLHLLDDLAAVLFTFKLALRGHDGFDELAFRRVLEVEVQAFRSGIARSQFTPQLPVKLAVAGKALQIIKNDDVGFVRLGIEVAQKRDHARTLHKITAARNVIGKDGLDVIAMKLRIGTAALFLALKAGAFEALFRGRNAAVNQRGYVTLDVVLMVHGSSFSGRLFGGVSVERACQGMCIAP